MSDCCYMRVRTRDVDAPAFEELGFVRDGTVGRRVTLYDEQANYAHEGDLPRDAVFTARHGSGSDYTPGVLACDGATLVDLPASIDGSPLLPLLMAPEGADGYAALQPDMDALRVYQAVALAACRILKAWELMEPAPVVASDLVPIEDLHVALSSGVVRFPLSMLVPFMPESIVLEIQRDAQHRSMLMQEWKDELRSAIGCLEDKFPVWFHLNVDDCHICLERHSVTTPTTVVELP